MRAVYKILMKILSFRSIVAFRVHVLGFAAIFCAVGVMPVFAHEGESPGHLSASLVDGDVVLTWDAPVTDAELVTGYEIVRRLPYDKELALSVSSIGKMDLVSHTSPNSYVEDTARDGATYVYRVRAMKGNQRSSWSNYVKINSTHVVSFDVVPVPVLEPPSAPRNLQATVENGTIALSWQAPDDDPVTGYYIMRRVNDENSPQAYVDNTNNNRTTYSDQIVEANVSYFYWVGAIGSGGTSEMSDYVNVSIPVGSVPASFYTPIKPPVHMASTSWSFWIPGNRHANEFIVNFTIHKNLNSSPPSKSGFYMMLGHSSLRGIPFYFGLQTDVSRPGSSSEKGLIFSRWETRNLSNAKVAVGGWSQSSGHEGDFIGVRISYDWNEGEYQARISPEDGNQGEDGWYGVWIKDLSTNVTTWGGSLKFPPRGVSPHNPVRVYSTMEIYGGPRIKPVNISKWHVSVMRPSMNGVKASRIRIKYNGYGKVPNSDATYVETDDAVHFRAGGFTRRITSPTSFYILD